MSRTFEISETGLKLIKAYEGYRPVDRELVTGQRVVGYGHRLYADTAIMMSKAEAEETLRYDLAPFEDMINTEVHAPITQGQFDALCSFAFNIGPKAFLESDCLRALNNGRPLDAANGLDIWRKSEIAGKTYVVDALMRRRTAEKALFLRTERELPAGRADLPPVADTMVAMLSTEDALPVFTEDDANGVVATAPYEAFVAPTRRREDGPAGALELSELDEVVTTDADVAVFDNVDTEVPEIEPLEVAVDTDADDVADKLSPIAEAATGIVARLEALIEDADESLGQDDAPADWPESLITADKADTDTDNVVTLPTSKLTKATAVPADVVKLVKPADPSKKPDIVIDALAQDDAFRDPRGEARKDSASKYIQSSSPQMARDTVVAEPEPEPDRDGGAGLWIPVLLGFILLGASAAAMMRGSQALLGEWGPVLTFAGFTIGVMMILAGIYAALRTNLRD